MYLIKVGDQYLTMDGTLSDLQRDAMRVDVDRHPTPPRFVHLKDKTPAIQD